MLLNEFKLAVFSEAERVKSVFKSPAMIQCFTLLV